MEIIILLIALIVFAPVMLTMLLAPFVALSAMLWNVYRFMRWSCFMLQARFKHHHG